MVFWVIRYDSSKPCIRYLDNLYHLVMSMELKRNYARNR